MTCRDSGNYASGRVTEESLAKAEAFCAELIERVDAELGPSLGGPVDQTALSEPPLSSPARSTNQSSAAGLASESRLAALAGSPPCRILLTGTSSFLPDSVRGTSSIRWIASGTWRGEQCSRTRLRISADQLVVELGAR